MRPIYRIFADSQEITALVSDRLLSLTLIDEAGTRSDRTALRLDNRDGRMVMPRRGAELEIRLGYEETGTAFMGLFTVDEVEVSGPPDVMTVSAKAADMRAGMKAPRTRSWHDVTLGDIVRTVSGDHGLTAAIPAELATVVIAHVDQTEESDLNLLTRLAKDNNALAKPAAGRLLFTPKGRGRTASGALMPAVALTRTDLKSYRARFADRDRYKAVTAFWHDPDTAERRPVTAGEGTPVMTMPGTSATESEACEAARAKLAALARGSATLQLSCAGNPELAAEARLTVSGLGGGIDGLWITESVEHRVDGSGYWCEVSAKSKEK